MSAHAERALVAALLQDPTPVLGLELETADFSSQELPKVFETIRQMATDGRAVDLITVGERLDMLAELGRLVKDTPAVPAHVQHYADAIRSHSWRRRLGAALRTAADNLDRADDPEAVVGTVMQQLAAAGRVSKARALDAMALAKATVHALDAAQQAAENGGLTGIPTGIRKLDAVLGGLHAGDLVVIGARPKVGKTALLLTAALNAAVATYRVGIVSAEMSASELGLRLAAMLGQLSVGALRSGRLSEHAWHSAAEATGRMRQLPLQVLDQPAARVSDIVRQAHAWARSTGLDVLGVDYLQRLQPDGRAERRDLAVGMMAQQLKTLARDLDIPVVLLAQLSRDVERRPGKRPNMADLRDSGQIEQEADQILLLYRPGANDDDADPSDAEIIIDANRHGPAGRVEVHFEPTTGRWS